MDRLSILRADVRGQWLQAIASTGTEDQLRAIRVPIGPEGGGLAQAYLTKETIVCAGLCPVPDGLRLQPPYDQIKSLRSRVFAVLPLIAQGQAIGVLAADRNINRVPFDEATLDALQGLASQAALALEHARLYAAAQPVLSRSLHLSVVYPAFARAVKALLPYDRIGVIVPEGPATCHGSFGCLAPAGLLAGTVVGPGGGHRCGLGAQEQTTFRREGSDGRAGLLGFHLCSPTREFERR